ncbi:NUDIX domain-containing protein [Balneicella halophila]|uniref:NUDIX domain-containing protein n=1 Tax=Balneicella halophila TaxID=1537566 RepID=A0A7L4UQV1_BALHA|nr:CoA pyrophosphatase [Balneicella halophila]PVX52049.1 NUDIX domain-containing protein [Balneicella halophila]
MQLLDNLDNVISLLKESLATPLPGPKAQELMAPSFRNEYKSDKNLLTQSGVLLLLYNKNEIPHFVLMKRSSKLRTHSGQIGLPGGKTEQSDTSYYHTAIRETYEELGISHNFITLLGKLTPLYIPISNFMVHPFIAYATETLHFVANDDEVDEILEIPLRHLLSEKSVTEDIWEKSGKEYRRPFFAVGEHKVWGATAMILSEFRELLFRK